MGTPTGLDYAAVAAVLDLYGVRDKRAVFDDIRVMEAEGLKALHNGRRK